MNQPPLTEHAIRNRAQWDAWAPDYAEAGRRSWAAPAPTWGTFSIPEHEVGALGDTSRFTGLDLVELGCGTAYFSAWFARMGARPHGIDNSPAQLATARELQHEHGLDFPLELGTAEALPFADDSFDIAFSEYGASIWCDPHLWIPEAARVLRPGGELIFLVNTPLSLLCAPETDAPAGTELLRPQLDMLRFEWPDDDQSVEFHLPHGKMIDLLAANGLRVERLIELYAPADAVDNRYMTAAWAQRWPAEEIWVTKLAT